MLRERIAAIRRATPIGLFFPQKPADWDGSCSFQTSCIVVRPMPISATSKRALACVVG
jgi:hypothetical protein